ncbi:hypothetical protein [Echinimonas agarilytica]|uniref:Right handed beta helix domain-containing protein n=1 Tax=Echinimonas agarilytica TaxID=1215918 RepID=A0AA41WC01_9GAMM|nr:hypothetical protein [Echinimonas agarilytica]MCM2681513.1 hypothetical protein [Echinimonas agarilytica]
MAGFIKKYLVVTGILINISLLWVVFAKPDFYWGLQKSVEKNLRKTAPPVANVIFGEVIRYSLKDDLKQLGFDQWSPKPALPTSSNIIRSDQFKSLQAASNALSSGDTLQISQGTYQQAFIVKANNVTIEGLGHVVLESAIVDGKGAIVSKANNLTIRNIECRNIKAKAQNGACVRFHGKNLSLEHVYFHSGQQGLLTSNKAGKIIIEDSWFINLGKSGRAHGIYVGSDTELYISDSVFLGAKDQGHEIKSRASRTLIQRSIIASLSGFDSRLIDIPNGGELFILESILEQGPRSVNETAIGYGLEGKKYSLNTIKMRDNIIILERDGKNNLLHLKNPDTAVVASSNLVISSQTTNLPGLNFVFDSRAEAKLAPYPHLPPLPKHP